MKNITLISTFLATAAVLAGCSSTPSEPEDSGIPSWVLTPQFDDGLAATGCTPAVGNLSVESSRADLLARQQLAAALGTQIQSLAEDYQRQIDTEEDGMALGGNFEQITRQIVDERLVGSQRITADYVSLNNQDNFCSMMGISNSTLEEILALSAQAAEVPDEVFTSSQLRERHLSQEALNRLDRALD